MAADAPGPAPVELTGDQVLGHLDRVIQWYRQLSSLQQAPAVEDIVLRDRLHQTSVTAVRLAFAFGRAAAAMVNPGPDQPRHTQKTQEPLDPDDPARLTSAAAEIASRIESLRAQLNQLDAQIARA